MRRSDREITDSSEMDSIIRACSVCHLGLADGDQPYVVPLSFGYDGQAVYFHSAKLGRKIEILRHNPRVCVQFAVNDGLVPGPEACDYTVAFRSVTGFGTAAVIEDPDAKRAGLAALMAQYAEGAFTFPEAMVQRTAVIRVDLEKLTGKQSLGRS